MVKEVNQNIFVNDWDYPDKGDHHCDDPEKKKLVEKLGKMITDSLDRKLTGGPKENHFDFWILDRLLTKEEVRFMLSFKERRVGYTTPELAKMNNMTEEPSITCSGSASWSRTGTTRISTSSIGSPSGSSVPENTWWSTRRSATTIRRSRRCSTLRRRNRWSLPQR